MSCAGDGVGDPLGFWLYLEDGNICFYCLFFFPCNENVHFYRVTCFLVSSEFVGCCSWGWQCWEQGMGWGGRVCVFLRRAGGEPPGRLLAIRQVFCFFFFFDKHLSQELCVLDQVVSNTLLELWGQCINLGVSSELCCCDSKRFDFCVILVPCEDRSSLQDIRIACLLFHGSGAEESFTGVSFSGADLICSVSGVVSLPLAPRNLVSSSIFGLKPTFARREVTSQR